MNPDKEQMWQAYLDGELSAAEIAEFEQQLSPEEREQLAAEMQFERELAERLSQDAACPELLWRRVQRKVAKRSGVAGRYRRAALSIAATIAIAFAAAYYMPALVGLGGDDAVSAAVTMSAESEEELRNQSMTHTGQESAVLFLRANGVNVPMAAIEDLPMAKRHRPLRILGARQAGPCSNGVYELLIGCCDQPVKIVFAPKGSSTAALIGRAAGSADGDVQAMRDVDGYITAVVTKHHGTASLLDLFDEHEAS